MTVGDGWSHERYCSAVEAEVARLAEVVEGAVLAVEVPTCPGWTVGKLVRHVGIIHRWAEHIVRERTRTPVTSREVPVKLPEDDAEYSSWLAEGGETLVTTLRAAGGEVPVWSWGGETNSVFWARRMLHESTVHRADAEITLGREPDIAVPVAVDGAEELLDNLRVAPWLAEGLAEPAGSGERLHFHATDAGEAGEWTVTLVPGGFTWERGHGKGDVAVRGTAGDLLLLLYGRRDPAEHRYEIFGDRPLLDRWLTKTAF
ncbi:maleylpyruvate isomerase family mycothiol-dependent enzyme [Sphaerisporangium rhizosphaerae]|uniref:Maleylpyruvate isomerase family mycothiol-dependent enzyme n=1 Tax=Sphaerisporangium rhizosphaerae TaxID=2269375 RepID=A0ABW2P4L1_9ACTN